jgi:hypothetical protein
VVVVVVVVVVAAAAAVLGRNKTRRKRPSDQPDLSRKVPPKARNGANLDARYIYSIDISLGALKGTPVHMHNFILSFEVLDNGCPRLLFASIIAEIRALKRCVGARFATDPGDLWFLQPVHYM